MYLTKYTPFIYDIKVDPWSIIVCEIKLKETTKPIKLNINTQIYYKNPDHINRIDVVTSETYDIYTSSQTHLIKMKIPGFQNRSKSFVYISLDPNEDVNTKIFIESLMIEDNAQYEYRKYTELERLKLKLDKLRKGDIDIVCEGLMLGDSGFAKAMRNIVLELDKYCNIKAIPLDGDNINFLNTQKGYKLKKLIDNSIDPFFWIGMNNPMGVSKHNCYSIGYVMFETEIFPHKYVEHLKQLEEIWTPSNFCKDSMMKSGLDKDKIFVIPLGVDIELFNPKKVEPMTCSELGVPEYQEKYKFLCVCGYSERKGISVLIRSFAEEFAGNNDVLLYIKSGWYVKDKAQTEINEMIKDIQNPPKVHLDFNIYPDHILAKIYKMANVFVLPTRGEGWLLPASESMAMELPTISTRWGGQLEFMNDDNSYLIDIDGTAPEPRCDWICQEYIGGKFAVPNKDHLKKLMRHIYENRDEAKAKGKIARQYILENFTWKISCKKMYKRIENIVKDLYEKESIKNDEDNINKESIKNDEEENNNEIIINS